MIVLVKCILHLKQVICSSATDSSFYMLQYFAQLDITVICIFLRKITIIWTQFCFWNGFEESLIGLQDKLIWEDRSDIEIHLGKWLMTWKEIINSMFPLEMDCKHPKSEWYCTSVILSLAI